MHPFRFAKPNGKEKRTAITVRNSFLFGYFRFVVSNLEILWVKK